MRDVDAVVVGGGPAGLSAAITLAKAGRSVMVLEKSKDAPGGPGETFHPGIEAIFDQLGIGDAMRADASARHLAVIVERAGHREIVAYENGWRGFQIRRRRLIRHLARRLENVGGEISRGNSARKLDQTLDRNIVETEDGSFRSRWLIDASGMAGWLDRRRATSMQIVSEPIWLRYGYDATTVSDGTLPRLRIDDGRWIWRAPLGDGETAWVTCRQGQPFIDRMPDGARGADGTWCLSRQPAGSGYFRVGDAACRLDPSNGHGVLRAMMSAIMAAHLAIQSDSGLLDRERAAQIYDGWIRYWFAADARQLAKHFPNVLSGATQHDNQPLVSPEVLEPA
ncbi:MAG: FAD-dependent oxidoreductase [Pseudomonadota bacterium]